MRTGERDEAIDLRVFAEWEARRLSPFDPDEQGRFEVVGLSPRQARTIAAKSYWFLRAFFTETARRRGPRRMPDWVKLELATSYRRGGFSERMIEALVAADGDLSAAAARKRFIVDVADGDEEPGEKAAPSPLDCRILDQRGTRRSA